MLFLGERLFCSHHCYVFKAHETVPEYKKMTLSALEDKYANDEEFRELFEATTFAFVVVSVRERERERQRELPWRVA